MASVNFTNSVYKINEDEVDNISYIISGKFIGLNSGTGSLFVIYNGDDSDFIYSSQTIEELEAVEGDITGVRVGDAVSIIGGPFKGIKQNTRVIISGEFNIKLKPTEIGYVVTIKDTDTITISLEGESVTVTVAGGSSETAESIKTKYESNDDTNAFTDAEKTKLEGIEEGATVGGSDPQVTTSEIAARTGTTKKGWSVGNVSAMVDNSRWQYHRRWLLNYGGDFDTNQRELIAGVERIEFDFSGNASAESWTWVFHRVYNNYGATNSYHMMIRGTDTGGTHYYLSGSVSKPTGADTGVVKVNVYENTINVNADVYIDYRRLTQTDYQAPYTNELVIDVKADLQELDLYFTSRLPEPDPFPIGVWTNEFPNALELCPNFKTKILSGDDVEIVLLGDSLTASMTTTTELDGVENLPPHINTLSWVYHLWNSIVKNKPQYDRFDSAVNSFTETSTTGSYSTGWALWDSPDWSGEYRGKGSITRLTAGSEAAVSFGWNLADYEKLNFIYRRDQLGASVVTVTITEGAGQVEIYDNSTSSWVEANAYTFSMREPAHTEGDGNSLYVDKLPLKFRRVATTGNITITISKGINSDRLMYWGTERWNGGNIRFTNVGRGGRVTQTLQKNFLNDVIDRSPDLILFELPLINQYTNYRNVLNGCANGVHDFVWGDRSGAINPLNLKDYTGNFATIEMLCVIPHYRKEFLSGNEFLKETTISGVTVDGEETAYEAWQKVKKLFIEKGDVKFIDLGAKLLREADAREWTYEESYTSSSVTSIASFTADTVHPNDLGAELWARYITPIFDIDQ